MLNTHPFAMHGRIMAHNGGFGELPLLDEQLGPYAGLVLGDTDSERYFALITQQTDAHGGDVGAGITAGAARWIAASLPVSSLNTIVAAPGELWGAALSGPACPAHHRAASRAGRSRPRRRACTCAARRPRCTYPRCGRHRRSSRWPPAARRRGRLAGDARPRASSSTSGPT